MKFTTGKKNVNNIGAKKSWSKSILVMTLGVLDKFGNNVAAILGSSLQYHRCKNGEIYNPPVKIKSKFLFMSNFGFFSIASCKYRYLIE